MDKIDKSSGFEIDKELVEKASENPDDFASLFLAYYPKVLNYIFRRSGDIYISQDITSEVFIKIHKNLKKFRFIANTPFSSWVYKIASNEVANYFRKHKNKPDSIDDLMESKHSNFRSDLTPENEIIIAQEEASRFSEFIKYQRLILKLPEKFQDVLVLRYFENMKIREISEIKGISEGTVKSLIHRGLKKLRDQSTF